MRYPATNTGKLARESKPKLWIGIPRLIEASQRLTAPTSLANAFDAYCSSVVASRVAFISSPCGMSFAQLGFGRKPRNYTSLSVLLS